MKQKEIEISIKDVEIKYLQTHPDHRGFFRELIRSSDPFFKATNDSNPSGFMQWSHSKMGKNTVKAWHFHHKQIDWWYIGLGVFDVHLIDNREESPTYRKHMNFKLGDAENDAHEAIVKIPDERLDRLFRPLSFDEYVGQRGHVDNLRVFVEAARRRGVAVHAALELGLGPGEEAAS